MFFFLMRLFSLALAAALARSSLEGRASTMSLISSLNVLLIVFSPFSSLSMILHLILNPVLVSPVFFFLFPY